MASMIRAMTDVAVECLRNPRRASYWSTEKDEYVCPDRAGPATAEIVPTAGADTPRPKLEQHFKIVFLAVFGGTILFTLICVACHVATDGQPPAPLQKMVDTLLDMAKIGFGAMVGLLGGKTTPQDA